MKRRIPPLNALRAFEAAARLGRMTAAAQELSVSPGAISRQVGQLELHLGLPLLEGTKANPVLTQAGRTLQPVLSQAFDQIERCVQQICDHDQGPLDVACLSTFTVKWLIPRLFDFHAQHPRTEVRLRTTDTHDAERDRCDVLITAQATAAQATNSTYLFPERLGLVLAPPLAQGLHIANIVDVQHLPMLHTRTRRNAWAMWATAAGVTLATEGIAAGPEFEHYYFTLESAVQGLGVAVAPWHLVIDDLQAGRLLAPLGFVESGYHYVAQHRSNAHPQLEVFCDWLRTQARNTPVPSKRHPSSHIETQV